MPATRTTTRAARVCVSSSRARPAGLGMVTCQRSPGGSWPRGAGPTPHLVSLAGSEADRLAWALPLTGAAWTGHIRDQRDRGQDGHGHRPGRVAALGVHAQIRGSAVLLTGEELFAAGRF